MVVAGRALEGGDVAVMMVEAGGTEATWDIYESGTQKVDESVLAEGLEFSKQYIKEVIDIQHELVKAVGEPETMAYEAFVDYSDEIYAAVDACWERTNRGNSNHCR